MVARPYRDFGYNETDGLKIPDPDSNRTLKRMIDGVRKENKKSAYAVSGGSGNRI